VLLLVGSPIILLLYSFRTEHRKEVVLFEDDEYKVVLTHKGNWAGPGTSDYELIEKRIWGTWDNVISDSWTKENDCIIKLKSDLDQFTFDRCNQKLESH